MLKALVIKQLRELLSFIISGIRVKRKRTALLFGLLLVWVLLVISVSVYALMYSLAGSLLGIGFGWLCFSLAELAAAAMAILGGMFTAKAMLFDATDNEQLLSMPVKPSLLLTARLLGVIIMNLVCCGAIMLPTLAAYLAAGGGLGAAAAFLPMLLAVTLLSTVISCLLGWLLSFAASKVKRRGLVTVVLSFVLLIAYFVVCIPLQTWLLTLIANPDGVAGAVEFMKYPGLAGEGELLPLAACFAVAILLSAAGLLPLAKNFTRIALGGRSRQTVRQAVKFEKLSIGRTLLLREYKRLISCPIYLINCSLGLLLLPIAAVALLVKGGAIREMIGILSVPTAPLLITAMGMIASMVDLTAPSLALEGKTLWQLRSLPIDEWAILRAKLLLQLVPELPLLLICHAAGAFALRLTVAEALLSLIAVFACAVLTAAIGLGSNLLLPGLEWTSETAAVKQSPAVMIAIFGGWIIAMLPIGIGVLIPGVLAVAVTAAVYTLLAAVLVYLIKRFGTRRLQSLG